MGFIMKGAPYATDNTPIYNVDMEDGVLGKANNNGSITLNSKLKDPKQIDDVIEHEKVHLDQMKRGDQIMTTTTSTGKVKNTQELQ